MVTCTEPNLDSGCADTDRAELPSRQELVERWNRLRDGVDSEWNAFSGAFAGPGTQSLRKWLGWALYRLATRVNPEVRD